MLHVLIIAQEWLFRAYIGAELIEAGFEVTGAADIASAVRQLEERSLKSRLVIIDAQGLQFDIENTLSSLCPGAPLLLNHGTWDYPSQLKWQAAVVKLVRPVSVGQVVPAAGKLLAKMQ